MAVPSGAGGLVVLGHVGRRGWAGVLQAQPRQCGRHHECNDDERDPEDAGDGNHCHVLAAPRKNTCRCQRHGWPTFKPGAAPTPGVTHQTLALVGAVGGAGTTRTAVECGGLLARDGLDVAVLDAAFATQGLAAYVPGRIETDITSVVVDETPIDEALTPITTALPGDLIAAPARAPFERVARAKTAGAADRFERAVAAAGLSQDVVIVDTPPVAANQAVAAVDACDRLGLVAPATRRGADGVARMTGVVEDVGTTVDGTIVTKDDGADVLQNAVARLPPVDVTEATECPSVTRRGGALAEPLAGAVEALLGIDLERELEESGGLTALLPGRS